MFDITNDVVSPARPGSVYRIVPAAPTTTTLSYGTVVPIPVLELGNKYEPTAAAFKLCGIFLGV